MSVEQYFAEVPINGWFRFRHHPDEGPFIKTGRRTYVLARPVERRVGTVMAPVELLIESEPWCCVYCGGPAPCKLDHLKYDEATHEYIRLSTSERFDGRTFQRVTRA